MTAPRVDIRPDPRISNQRPGWLADDTQWRDQLQALDLDDVRWIERHWEDASGAGPAVDTSWITYETVGGLPWFQLVIVLLGAMSAIFVAVAVAVAVAAR